LSRKNHQFFREKLQFFYTRRFAARATATVGNGGSDNPSAADPDLKLVGRLVGS
jgi:hypothetical protein